MSLIPPDRGQQIPSQVAPDLAAYIIANTGGSISPYAWAPEQEGLSKGAAQAQAASDWFTSNHVGARALGAIQTIGGELEALGGLAAATTCETVLGCIASTYLTGAGLDNANAGYNLLQTGQSTATLGQQGGQALGLSPNNAALFYGATQLVPAGVEAYLANAAVDAQATANAAARASYNVTPPPQPSVVAAMNSPSIQAMAKATDCVDCSEIAWKLLNASGGSGSILEVRPMQNGNLNVLENGAIEGGQYYHQVYTDGQYIYDPRWSLEPVPFNSWQNSIRQLNPNGVQFSNTPKGLK